MVWLIVALCSTRNVGSSAESLCRRLGDLLLVAAALGLDREAVHGRRELERHEVDVILVVRIVEHGVEVDLVDLGHRADVAGHERVGLDEVLALQEVRVRRP